MCLRVPMKYSEMLHSCLCRRVTLRSNTPSSHPSIYVTPRAESSISCKAGPAHRVSLCFLAGEWVVINDYNWFSLFCCGCLRHSLLLLLLLLLLLDLLRQQRSLWPSSLIRVELIRSVQAASPMDNRSLTPTNPRAGAKHGRPRDIHRPLVEAH